MTFTADGKRQILLLIFYSLLVILELITQISTNVFYYSPQIKIFSLYCTEQLKTDSKSFIFVVCRLTSERHA